jgi:hypothetical protein
MSQSNQASRRGIMTAGLGLAAAAAAAAAVSVGETAQAAPPNAAAKSASRAESGFVTARDGAQIFYKDWGPKDAQPIVFHHGWPLSADDWDAQMMFFLSERAIASSPMTAGAMAARPRPTPATRWITYAADDRQWSSSST